MVKLKRKYISKNERLEKIAAAIKRNKYTALHNLIKSHNYSTSANPNFTHLTLYEPLELFKGCAYVIDENKSQLSIINPSRLANHTDQTLRYRAVTSFGCASLIQVKRSISAPLIPICNRTNVTLLTIRSASTLSTIRNFVETEVNTPVTAVTDETIITKPFTVSKVDSVCSSKEAKVKVEQHIQPVLMEEQGMMTIKSKNKIENNKTIVLGSGYAASLGEYKKGKKLNVENKTNLLKISQTINTINKYNEFNCNTDTFLNNSNPVDLIFYVKNNSKKPILSHYLKSMSYYNLIKKGVSLNYSKIQAFNFNTNKNKLIINIDKLLNTAFKAMNCLISKPVFVNTPDKLKIQIFYFLMVPTYLFNKGIILNKKIRKKFRWKRKKIFKKI